MDREELAKQLREADRACYKDLIPAELIDVVMAASPVGNAAYLAMADVAIAACAKAAEDGYKEAWFDGACTSGCECAVCMMDSDTAWDDSDTRKQWSKP